jgi:hypothetical protein
MAISALTAGLLGAGAGAGLSSLFANDEEPKILMTPEQQAAYSKLLPSLTKAGNQFAQIGGQPYTGQLTAPLSDYETTGLKSLGEYLASPLPTQSNLFGLSQAELEKTLGGKEYNPETGPYYQAYRTNIMRELQKAKDRLAANSSAADAYFGGGRLQQERELEEGTMGSLAQTLGQLYEQERMNRLNTVPTAINTLGWAEQLPVNRVTAAEQLGALPRQVQQADLTARYNDYIRQLQNMGMSLQAATSMATQNPQYWMPQTDTSGMSNMLGQLAMMAILQQGGGGNYGPSNTTAAGNYYIPTNQLPMSLQ